MSASKVKLCCVFNTPSLYRESIYKKIDDAYDCDWFFEDTDNQLMEFDTNQLKKVVRLHTYKLGPFYVVKGLFSILCNKDYSHFLMMGHSRNISIFIFILLKQLFYSKKRVYLWTHGFYGKETLIECIWKKLLLKSADILFIYGDYACNLMEKKYGFNKEKLYPIHNSLDYDVQLKLRKEIKSSNIYKNYFCNNSPTIIFIGRLTPIKKLDMLIQSIADLKANKINYNLVLVGEGSERHKLEQSAKRLNIVNQIWFYGACYDQKTNAELVYNADLCVAPGNIGLTSIHALMFGCPAISHNNFSHQMPEFEAIKEGVTGTYFEYNSQESLDNSIIRWFFQSNYDREKIRKACYNEIDTNWNPEYQMKIIKSVI